VEWVTYLPKYHAKEWTSVDWYHGGHLPREAIVDSPIENRCLFRLAHASEEG
jgi:hypothetical protein